MRDPNFQRALDRAQQIVATWPAWKQTSWLVSTMATNPPCPTAVASTSADQNGAGSIPHRPKEQN